MKSPSSNATAIHAAHRGRSIDAAARLILALEAIRELDIEAGRGRAAR